MSIVFDESYLRHKQSSYHPEKPERLKAIKDKMAEHSLWKNIVKPRSATTDELLLNHSERYIRRIENTPEGYLDPDTYLREETYGIARKAVGGALDAAGRAYGRKEASLALLRPPGHHATRDHAMGFCYFNNIAVAAKKMKKDLDRIAIIDLDVHHGNGTQDSFYGSDEVLYVSTHQRYIFPGTGAAPEVGDGKGEGYTVNIPFDSGAGDASFRLAVDKIILPLVRQYEPDMIMISMGTDTHYEEMLAGLTLSSRGYVENVKRLWRLSGELCEWRLALFLEGGYALEPLGEMVAGVYAATEEKEIPLRYDDVADKRGSGKGAVKRVLDIQRKYWDL